MSTPLHTPGPWTVIDDHPERACLYIHTGGPKRRTDELATVFGAPEDTAERQADGAWINQPHRAANARLMASAPDLLEALKYARRFVDSTTADIAYIEAVIAKAEGRE